MKHPFAGFEEIRFNRKGSLLSATVILLGVTCLRVFSLAVTNFIFNADGLESMSPIKLMTQTVIPFGLWIAANYLVSSITKGQGRLRDVYMGTAYALAPYAVFSAPVAVLSNLFTAQEQSIYYFLYYGMFLWCGFLLFVEIMVIQGYEVMETVGNTLSTLFAAAVMIVIAFAVAGICMQNYTYIYTIIAEVMELV